MDSRETYTLGFWGDESEDIIKRDFPIHRACRDGDIKALNETWAVASYDHLTAEDKFYGWTPIHWAAYFGKIECLNTLLRFGVCVNICTSRFKQTPCHIASFGAHPQCLLALLRAGANFHAQDYLGETPIHKAARVGNAECISVLLANGSRVNLCNSNGHTPCDLSRMQNFLECMRLLGSVESDKQLNGICNSNLHNGSSGMLLSTMNGHANGHADSNRKRLYDDESIPSFKRRRFNSTKNNGFLECGNGCHDDGMEVDVRELPNNDRQPSKEKSDASFRAPSPGMEMRVHGDEDMQLWCHLNGFSDTAETIPPSNSISPTSCMKHRQPFQNKNCYDKTVCNDFRGMQSRGWH